MTAPSLRARVRAEMIDEIKAAARRHLAADGANLSLRAVARDLGMVSSAMYRYFASRDDLLTALIVDAYDALGIAVERADRAAGPGDPPGRWLAVCHAARDWALASPHEYALIYGSPVPGYQAPVDTVAPASRAIRVLGTILADAYTAGTLRPRPAPPLPPALAAEISRVAQGLCPGVPEPALIRALGAWLNLFGSLSFELFGQLNNTISERDAFFAYQMGLLIDHIGLERSR